MERVSVIIVLPGSHVRGARGRTGMEREVYDTTFLRDRYVAEGPQRDRFTCVRTIMRLF